MNNEQARRELDRILDSVLERNIDFGKLYGFYMVVALISGLIYDLDGGARFGIDNHWFLLFFEISLFVLGLTILFSAVWNFKEVSSIKIIIYNFTRRGPLVSGFVVVMLTTATLMLLNFLVNPTFGSLGLVLIFTGLGLEVPVASYYKYLTNDVYDGNRNETLDNLVKMLGFEQLDVEDEDEDEE